VAGIIEPRGRGKGGKEGKEGGGEQRPREIAKKVAKA